MNSLQKPIFYILWSPDGPTNPHVRHKNLSDAILAQEEMGRKHPGQDFYLMAAMSRAKCIPVYVFEKESFG